jgi:methionyl aminopeptidase
MQCPTCNKLRIPPAYFCDQKCFKDAWATHKERHVSAKKAIQRLLQQKESGHADFSGYNFSGPLRPGVLSPRREIPAHIPKTEYADDPQGIPYKERTPVGSRILVHTPEQIAGIREACRRGRLVLDAAGRAAKVGVTTDEIDRVAHEKCIELECYPAPLKYKGFPKSICTSINECICHGIPDSRPLEDGDICNVDVSVYYKGYHADLNETFLIGECSEEDKKLVKCAYDSLEAAIAKCRPGTLYRDVGRAITTVAKRDGFSVVRAFCGHGVGEVLHGAPSIPHYANNRAIGVMKPGNIFTIEPMINAGKWNEQMWPDGWTATTRDGKKSAQFEHTMLVTETGVEVLTRRSTGSYIDRF